jgi:hypothetical protein
MCILWGDTLGCLEDIFGVHKLLHFFTLSIWTWESFVGIAYQGKDIVFRFIIEYSSFRDFGTYVVGLFLYEDF